MHEIGYRKKFGGASAFLEKHNRLGLRAFSTIVRLASCKNFKSLFILATRVFRSNFVGRLTRLGTDLGDWWKRQAVADQARCGRQ